ncbi:hypothetical protein DM02DRAFT_633594 [Periconia macrospinosa]|uniref:Uncharacterized protein n=1 Tax=Periconia macrospinosa TaxID=97972 RepID=A0A2V1DBL3_9PLEO|nr:hypothetical protein DM02DRAFT_633594 [Periconia macrospinosa]
MSTLRTLRFRLSSSLLSSTRLLSTTPYPLQQRMGSNPPSNQLDSPNASVRKDTPNTDPQSSASPDEHKTGDDHPAKQPDPQMEPDRKTGIGGESEVKGGKEGLGERTDR